jgi:hypothetical protein
MQCDSGGSKKETKEREVLQPRCAAAAGWGEARPEGGERTDDWKKKAARGRRKDGIKANRIV